MNYKMIWCYNSAFSKREFEGSEEEFLQIKNFYYKEWRVKIPGWQPEEGALHKEGGPARIWADGYKEWCKNGMYYREDGPACTGLGYNSWWINDVNLTWINDWIPLSYWICGDGT